MSTRITDLPQAVVLNGSEVIPMVQGGVTKQTTLDFINQAAPAAIIRQQVETLYDQTAAAQTATEALLVDFESQYLGEKPSAPSVDNQGLPLRVGAFYWNSALDAMFVWSGFVWEAFSSSVSSVNGYIGDVVLTKTDVGLSNVTNVQQAPVTRNVFAGDGLVGGGDLASDVVLALGLPDTLTTLTINDASGTTHTHAVDFPVTSVNGFLGDVVLTQSDVGLPNVDNTSDANKPVSTATQTALDGKEPLITKDLGYATWNGTSWSFLNQTYLQSETDPVFSASASASISGTDISNWNSAFGWGNHASAGYLLPTDIGVTVQAFTANIVNTVNGQTGDVVISASVELSQLHAVSLSF